MLISKRHWFLASCNVKTCLILKFFKQIMPRFRGKIFNRIISVKLYNITVLILVKITFSFSTWKIIQPQFF